MFQIPPRNSSDIIEVTPVDITGEEYRSTVRFAKDKNIFLES
jgi:hypothetical protein